MWQRLNSFEDKYLIHQFKVIPARVYPRIGNHKGLGFISRSGLDADQCVTPIFTRRSSDLRNEKIMGRQALENIEILFSCMIH